MFEFEYPGTCLKFAKVISNRILYLNIYVVFLFVAKKTHAQSAAQQKAEPAKKRGANKPLKKRPINAGNTEVPQNKKEKNTDLTEGK